MHHDSDDDDDFGGDDYRYPSSDPGEGRGAVLAVCLALVIAAGGAGVWFAHQAGQVVERLDVMPIPDTTPAPPTPEESCNLVLVRGYRVMIEGADPGPVTVSCASDGQVVVETHTTRGQWVLADVTLPEIEAALQRVLDRNEARPLPGFSRDDSLHVTTADDVPVLKEE